MGQTRRRGGSRSPVRLHDGAAPVFDCLCGRREEDLGEACGAQSARAMPSTSTYTNVIFCCRHYSWRHATTSVSFFFWTVVSLLFQPLWSRVPLDIGQFSYVQGAEAASQENVDFEDVKDSIRATHYVRLLHNGDESESADDSLFASSVPYVFESTTDQRRLRSAGSHHSKKRASGSGLHEQEPLKTCALLVLAHDWPLSGRRTHGSNVRSPLDWSLNWQFLRQELERRAEFDTLVVLAPDVSSSSGRHQPVVTSLYHYSAYLARQVRLLLQSMLLPDPEPERDERRPSVIARQEALAARLSDLFPSQTLDDVFYIPLPEDMVTRWFNEASVSPHGSGDASHSSGPRPQSTSRSNISSSVGSDSKDQPRDTSTPLGLQATSSPVRLQVSDVDEGTPTRMSRRLSRLSTVLHKSFGKVKEGQSKRGLSRSPSASARVTSTSRARTRTSLSTAEDTRVTWTTEDDTADQNSGEKIKSNISSTCARVDLFLLGRGVGGLALRLMAVSPNSLPWDDVEDQRRDEWRQELLSLHMWLWGKLLGANGARINPEADVSERHLPTSALVSRWTSRRRMSLVSFPPLTRSDTRGRHNSTSDSTSTSSHGPARSDRFERGERGGRLNSQPYSILKGSPPFAAADGISKIPGEKTEDINNDGLIFEEDTEEEEEAAPTDMQTEAGPVTGVRLRTMLLDHTPLAGKGIRRDEPRSKGSRLERVRRTWGAIREALRGSSRRRRRLDPSSELKRILLHLDGTHLLCTLAYEEKQIYTGREGMRGSLVTLFGNVLYYGDLNIRKPAATASQLGIAYPLLMQSVGAEKAQRCNNPQRPCKFIDAAASPLNSPAEDTCMHHRVFYRGEQEGSVPECRPAGASPSPTNSQRPQANSSSSICGCFPRRRQPKAAAMCALRDSDLPAGGDGVESQRTQVVSGTSGGSNVGGGKKAVGTEQRSKRVTGKTGLKEHSGESSVRRCTGTGSREVAAVEGEPTEEEGSTSDDGYEGGAESSGDAEDCHNGKRRSKRSAGSTAKHCRRASCPASWRTEQMHAILFSVDICRATPRRQHYEVTLALLEAINQNQAPHTYNPFRIGIWESVKPPNRGSGRRHSDEDGVRRSVTVEEAVTEEKQRILLHMAVRFFQLGKHMRRYEFSGDKHIYPKAWFTLKRATCGPRRTRQARGQRS